MAIARESSSRVERVGMWIIMLPRTVVHWQSSVGLGDKFGAEQILTLGANMGLQIGFFCMFVNFLDISLKVNRIALNFFCWPGE